ncbi:MAG: type II toxin-antitoxin system death-on-curing family toxin [Acidobacteria bacterium]|nr:type II toxin-antitoxin system death-on-curing family toxin [Acidobacteriota bacterium]
MTDVYCIDINEAVWSHFQLMWSWDETYFGIDRIELIESALTRPKFAAQYQDADLIEQAATLCYGLIKNHPWRGGNKRTATHLMEHFLLLNGIELTYDLEEMLLLALSVEADDCKVGEIAQWLRGHMS